MSVVDRTNHLMETQDTQVCDEAKSLLRDHLYKVMPPAVITGSGVGSDSYARIKVASCIEQGLRQGVAPRLPKQLWGEVTEGLVADIFGLGVIDAYLRDGDVSEVMINGLNSIFVERDGRLVNTHNHFESDAQLRGVIDRIVSAVGRRVDERSPMVAARTPQGHRVQIVLPPVALDGPSVTIRKFRDRVFSLRELVNLGAVSEKVRQILRLAVRSRLNIMVVGGTGSGKTTLLNALSLEIPFGERIVTIEDSAELRFSSHPHVVRLETRLPNIEGTGQVGIRDLVISSLRMRPDRIIVGEVRGAESLEMLQAMNTGHDGSLTTLHANSCEDAVSRLVSMVGYGADLPLGQVLGQIASAFDLVIHQSRLKDGRRVISAINGVGCATETSVEMVPYVELDHRESGSRPNDSDCYKYTNISLLFDAISRHRTLEEDEVKVCTNLLSEIR